MTWWQIAVGLGVVAPWLFMGQALLIAFKERGIGMGLATWIGASLLPVLALLAVMGLAEVFL